MQKRRRVEVSKKKLDKLAENPTFIITGDETWTYEYDVKSEQQSSKWHSKNKPKPKKTKQTITAEFYRKCAKN